MASLSLQAQTDTVYIEKKVIINDTIYQKKPKTKYKAKNKVQKGKSYRNLSKSPKLIGGHKYEWFVGGHLHTLTNNNYYTANQFIKENETRNFQSKLSPAFSYGAGVSIGIKRDEWSLESGLNYSILNQDFAYKTQELKIDSTIENYIEVVDEYYIFDTINEFTVRILKDGEWVEVTHYDVDSTFVSITEEKTRTLYDTLRYTLDHSRINRFQYFEVPIILGREWKTGNFRLSARGGVILGFLTAHSGHVLRFDEARQQFYLDQLSNQPYQRVSLSLLFGLGIEYRKYDGLSYFVEPYFRQSISDHLPSYYAYTMQHRSYGFRFGIRYYFKIN